MSFEVEKKLFFFFGVGDFFRVFFFSAEKKLKKRQHQKPGDGLPFILNGPIFPTSAAEIDPRDEACSLFSPFLSGFGGEERGKEGGGLGEKGTEERRQELPFRLSSLFLPLTLSLSPLGFC